MTAVSTRTRSGFLDHGTWSLSCAVFEVALELKGRDRIVFVEKACGGNFEVRRVVLRMLDADGARSNAFDRMAAAFFPVAAFARSMAPPSGSRDVSGTADHGS